MDAFPLSHGPSLKEVYSALKEVWHNLCCFFSITPNGNLVTCPVSNLRLKEYSHHIQKSMGYTLIQGQYSFAVQVLGWFKHHTESVLILVLHNTHNLWTHVQPLQSQNLVINLDKIKLGFAEFRQYGKSLNQMVKTFPPCA